MGDWKFLYNSGSGDPAFLHPQGLACFLRASIQWIDILIGNEQILATEPDVVRTRIDQAQRTVLDEFQPHISS